MLRRLVAATACALVLLVGGGGAAVADPTPSPTPSAPTPSPTQTQRACSRGICVDDPTGSTPPTRPGDGLSGQKPADLRLCLRVPDPSRPTAGVAGMIDRGPATASPSNYGQRGWGGFQLTVYDPGCAPALAGALAPAPIARLVDGPNTLAAWMVGAGLVVAAAATVATRYVLEVASIWTVVDDVVRVVQDATGGPGIVAWLMVALLCVAVVLAWGSWRRGALPYVAGKAAGAAGIAMLAVWLSVNSFVVGPTYDQAARETFRGMSSVVTGQPAAAADSFVADALIDRVIMPAWCQVMLGDNQAAQEKFCWRLYAAQSLTRDEVAASDADADEANRILRLHRDSFSQVAEEVRAEDPAAYAALAGSDTGRRVGPSALLLLGSLLVGGPLIAALAVLAVAKLVLRAAVAAIPAGALLWVFPGAQKHVPDLLRVVGWWTRAALFAMAGWLYIMAGGVSVIMASPYPLGTQLIVYVVATFGLVAAWKSRKRIGARWRQASGADRAKRAASYAAPVVAPAQERWRQMQKRRAPAAAKAKADRAEQRTQRWNRRRSETQRRTDPASVTQMADAVMARRAERVKARKARAAQTGRRPAMWGGRRARRSDIDAAVPQRTGSVTGQRRAPVRRPVAKKAVSTTAKVVAPKAVTAGLTVVRAATRKG